MPLAEASGGSRMSNRDGIPEHAERWAWFVDVLFGAIAAIAIANFKEDIVTAWHPGYFETIKATIAALAAWSFFVYDVAVYHVLIKKYPYLVTFKGFARFYLDIVMVFLLYMMLSAALASDPEKHTWGILLSVSFWHLAAAGWHAMAQSEESPRSPNPIAIMPHIGFIAIYWLIVLIVHCMVKRPINSTPVMFAVSGAIFVVSLWRWRQVVVRVAA
jgi:hypothetical protein